MFKIRQRTCLLIITVFVLIPCIIVLMTLGPSGGAGSLTNEQILLQRLAECHMRLQYLEKMYRIKQEDVILLTQYLGLQNLSKIYSYVTDRIPPTDKKLQNLHHFDDENLTSTHFSATNSYNDYSNKNNDNNNNNNSNHTVYNLYHNKSDSRNADDINNNRESIFEALSPDARKLLREAAISAAQQHLTHQHQQEHLHQQQQHERKQKEQQQQQQQRLHRNQQQQQQQQQQNHGSNQRQTGSYQLSLSSAAHSAQTTHRLISSASSTAIHLPTIYHFLPHLLDDANSLRPVFLQSKGRTDVSIVLGVPTVRREKQSYLISTLKNLIENMDDDEQNETLIVVFIGETDLDVIRLIAKEVQTVFEVYIKNGLIDIIAPSPSYYPNFDHLHTTLNDSLERVKWRSKQNLDFAYLMAYSQSKGTFYVQLEDDILAKHNFITLMKKFAITKSALIKPEQQEWLILDFCQLGFIGKMFKSADLPYLITFFQMFYSDKPVDWLLVSFLESKVCRIDKDQKHCNIERAKYWLHYRPSLFQHIGTSSSLKGKVQKLKDKQFRGKVPAFIAHINNPPAIVKTNIKPYKNYLIQRAYRGETYFWGMLPQPDDLIQFTFNEPIQLQRYLFRSGNSEHPSDRFYNTTVEILPVDTLSENSPVWNMYNSTMDGYLILGTFDAMGVAEGVLDVKIGAIKELRLHVHGDSENWVLLSEVELQVANSTEKHRIGDTSTSLLSSNIIPLQQQQHNNNNNNNNNNDNNNVEGNINSNMLKEIFDFKENLITGS